MSTAAGALRSVLGWHRPKGVLDWARQGLVAAAVVGSLATIPLMSTVTVLALALAGAVVTWTARRRPVVAGAAAVATLGVAIPPLLSLIRAEAAGSVALAGLSLLVPAGCLLMAGVGQRNPVASAVQVLVAELAAVIVILVWPGEVVGMVAFLAALLGALAALWVGRDHRESGGWAWLDQDSQWADHGYRQVAEEAHRIVSGRGWVLVISKAPRRRVRRLDLAAAAASGHMVARTLGLSPGLVQPVLVSPSTARLRRADVPGGVVTVVPQLPRLLDVIPARSELPARVRQGIERLAHVQPDEVPS